MAKTNNEQCSKMNWFNKNLSFKSDLILTLLNGLVIIGGVFVLNGLIARMYGLEILGEFLLVKRTFSSIVGILLIGMNIALPYYLSRNLEKSYADNSFLLFFIISVPLTVLLILSIFWFKIPGFYSNWFWTYIIYSLSISTQFITYALYRGYMNMIGANIFQLLGTAILPIIMFSSVTDIYEGIFWMGLCGFFVMIFAFIIRNNGLNVYAINFNQSKKLVKYGFERIPSIISQFILLAGIPLFLASMVNLESVAYFNSSLSLVRLALIIVNPISMILLPRISNNIASKNKGKLSDSINIILKTGIVFGVICTTYCYINAPLILSYWLGEVNENGVNILRMTILVFPFYTFSSLTRSPIDAVSERGYNSLIYGLSAVVLFVIIFIGKLLDFNLLNTALAGFITSHIVAGFLSGYYVHKFYQNKLCNFELLRDILFCTSLIFLINHFFSYINISAVFQLFITSIIYVIIGIILFKYSKTSWLTELKSNLYA